MDKRSNSNNSCVPNSTTKIRKRIKRAGKKNKKKATDNTCTDSLKIYYNNINGFMSKRESLDQAINAVTPDIVGLCETKLGRLSKPKIQGYETVHGNMKRGKEGLLVAVREGTFVSIEKMTPDTDEDGDNNILAVQVKYPKFNLRVIVAHAPQETANPDVRERFFQSLKLETERGQLNGESILVLGDMNGRLDSEKDKEDKEYKENLSPNKENSSPNGKALKEYLTEHGLLAANLHPNAVGKWTRIRPTKKNTEISAIDFIILDEALYTSIANLTVDECKAFTPYGVNSEKGMRKIVFSDHCALIMSVTIDVGCITVDEKQKETWKINEPGLMKYRELTSTRSLFFSDKKNTTDMYGLWERMLVNILDKCFKKKVIGKQPVIQRSVCMGSAFIRSVLSKIAAKGKIQRDVASFFRKKLLESELRVLEDIRVHKLKNTLSQFSEDQKTPPNAYWKVLKSVRGKEKTKITSVMKSDGVEVFSKEAIKQEILDEFKSRLRNRQPAEGWENYVEVTNELVEILSQADGDDVTEFTIEELLTAIKKLKKKKAPGPDDIVSEFLTEAGDGMLIPLLEILNEIKRSKQPPKQWNSVIITIIYKNKGSRKSLVNYRGIFLASIVSKVFERMLKTRMKSCMEKVNLCQAGARSNRGPPDNTFIVNAVIDHYRYLNKTLYITAYDFEQAFDSLWLQDCILSLHALGVPEYILKLIYNLNREAEITVKTPYGLTSSAVIEDIVQQGRVLAPDLCSASTAEYCGSNKGVAVGTCIISSLAFVDDMMDLSDDVPDAEVAHLQAVNFGRKKKMNYSEGKCKGMAVHGKKNDEVPQMYINDKMIELVSHLKYLGDIFQKNGKNDELVKDRLKRGMNVILKIEAILSETRFGKHTTNVSLLLYRALFLSSILFNSQAWRNLTETDYSQLQTLQLKLLKKIFHVPSTTSNSFMFLELGVLPIKYEIHQRQLVFLHHVLNLEEDDPVKCLYEQMKRLPSESNWLSDVSKSAAKYGINIDEEFLCSCSKDSYKATVRKAIESFAEERLKEECSGLSKTKDLRYEGFKTQPYLLHLYPHHANVIMKCRAKCLDIKSHRPFKFTNKICRGCFEEEETLSHILNCGELEENIRPIDISSLNEMDVDMESSLISMASRIEMFLDSVDY